MSTEEIELFSKYGQESIFAVVSFDNPAAPEIVSATAFGEFIHGNGAPMVLSDLSSHAVDQIIAKAIAQRNKYLELV